MKPNKVLLGVVAVSLLALLLRPAPTMATTLGPGGILTSTGLDIEMIVLPSSGALIGILQGYSPSVFPPSSSPANLALNTHTAVALCLYTASGGPCGSGGFQGAIGMQALLGVSPPAGAEILFSVFIAANQLGAMYQPYTVYTGPGARNSDGLTHDLVAPDGLAPDGTPLFDIGFELLLGPLGGPNPSGGGMPPSARDFSGFATGVGGLLAVAADPATGAAFRFYGAQAVPEPASLLLVGVGLVGLGGIAWRGRR